MVNVGISHVCTLYIPIPQLIISMYVLYTDINNTKTKHLGIEPMTQCSVLLHEIIFNRIVSMHYYLRKNYYVILISINA